jgi:hypothetical protein
MVGGEWALAAAVGSLVLSLLALWRTARFKVLDLRTQLRRDVAELRVTMDEMVAHINRALQPTTERPTESAALQALQREADTDSLQLEALRGRLNEINVVAPLASYKTLEAKCALTQAIRTRVHQLADKYSPAGTPLAKSGGEPQDNVAWLSATTRH